MQTAAPPASRIVAAVDPGHAVVRLFDACAPELFALALAVSGDADAAEAAVFDAFAAAMDLPAPPTRAAMAMRVRTAALARAPVERAGAARGADGERCAVELACYARLTVAEIAAELGIPPGEVMRRLSAGLRSLARTPAMAAG
ncbi:MAG TPA: sigma factor-like helix-turn-helix DNA-binding protein [Longimicrobium sp.]|nr:sigma factor-like helix-turn-helix DNA-binding protein [Longimicrobium sp.]